MCSSKLIKLFTFHYICYLCCIFSYMFFISNIGFFPLSFLPQTCWSFIVFVFSKNKNWVLWSSSTNVPILFYMLLLFPLLFLPYIFFWLILLLFSEIFHWILCQVLGSKFYTLLCEYSSANSRQFTVLETLLFPSIGGTSGDTGWQEEKRDLSIHACWIILSGHPTCLLSQPQKDTSLQ